MGSMPNRLALRCKTADDYSYPWNFEWNFNWLKHDPLYSAPFPDMLDRGARGQAMVDRAWDQWDEMLKTRWDSFEMNRLD